MLCAEMWMDLGTVIQSSVKAEREKEILCINTCGTQKRGVDELICKADLEKQNKPYRHQG